MSERFKVLRTLDSSQWDSSCDSVQLLAARILEDNQTGQQYLQVKFSNNGEQSITGLDIIVKSGSTQIAVHHFTDLNLSQGEAAGSKTLIDLPEIFPDAIIEILISNVQNKTVPSSKPLMLNSDLERAPFSNASKKFSARTVLLLATAIFLLFGLILSNFKIFESVTYQRSALIREDITDSSFNLFQLLSYLQGDDYALPLPFYIGIFGYFLSCVAATRWCILRMETEKSTPFVRLLPFLPAGFFFSLVGMLDSRDFVSLNDPSNGYFVLKRIIISDAVIACFILLLAAAICYLTFLVISHRQYKKTLQNALTEKKTSPKKKFSFKKVFCCFVEGLLIVAVTLFGDSIYTAHQKILAHNQASVRILYSEKVKDFLSENYGADNVQLGNQTVFAITHNNRGSGYNILDIDELYDTNERFLGYVYFCGTVRGPVKNLLTDSYDLSISYDFSDALVSNEKRTEISDSPSVYSYDGYWFNNDSTAPYYLGIQVDSSRSSPVLEIQIYSDYYRWTATAYQSTPTRFAYEDGFQQSYSEDFNLPDLAGTITFDFDKNIVIWTDEYDESIVFTNSITSDVFNAFVKKATGTTNSYGNNSQSIIEPIHLSGHYWCEQNSGDAYISMYSSPEQDGTVGNIEIYSQLEKANFSGILYSTGRNEYETIAETGASWRLCFYGSSETPAFELYYVLPSGNYQSFGEYVLDEHYYS